MTSFLDSSLRSYFDSTPIRAITGTVGLAMTAALITILCERELMSAAVARWRRSRLAAVDVVLLPLLVAFVIIVVVRFQRLTY